MFPDDETKFPEPMFVSRAKSLGLMFPLILGGFAGLMAFAAAGGLLHGKMGVSGIALLVVGGGLLVCAALIYRWLLYGMQAIHRPGMFTAWYWTMTLAWIAAEAFELAGRHGPSHWPIDKLFAMALFAALLLYSLRAALLWSRSLVLRPG